MFKKLIVFSSLVMITSLASAMSRGIYVTQSTAENTPLLQSLIQNSVKYGIDTFVIDINRPGKKYAKNIASVIANHIHYIARVVVFPHGGTDAEVKDKAIWAKRLALANYAIAHGAQIIQLDYIRYRALPNPSKEKAKNILTVVRYFRNNLQNRAGLQMDIFGVAAHGPAHTIGQDVKLLATQVDAFCPMVYPSHYEPFLHHAVRPYETVFNSLTALKNQLKTSAKPATDIYAYIELYNYRYPLSPAAKQRYISAEIKATLDAGVKGWYAWSPSNHYTPLFQALGAIRG